MDYDDDDDVVHLFDPDDHRDELEGMVEELGGWVMAFGEDLMRKKHGKLEFKVAAILLDPLGRDRVNMFDLVVSHGFFFAEPSLVLTF